MKPLDDEKLNNWETISTYIGDVFSKEYAAKTFLGIDPEIQEDMRRGCNPQTEDYANGEALSDNEVMVCSSLSASTTDIYSSRSNCIVKFESNEGNFYLIKQDVDKGDLPDIITTLQRIVKFSKDMARDLWVMLKEEHNFEEMEGMQK
jgi:hypothetical protein